MRHWFTTGMLAVGIASASLATTAQAADEVPTEPIEIAVHTSPGGGTDTTARMVALSTQEQLDQNVFVQNKKGGGGGGRGGGGARGGGARRGGGGGRQGGGGGARGNQFRSRSRSAGEI